MDLQFLKFFRDDGILVFRKKQLIEDPNAKLDSEPFIKPPWYSRTDKSAPKASEEIEIFLSSVEASLLSSQNFVKFPSNISADESKAFKELRQLKNRGVSVFLQDKSSQFVVAKSDIVASKVDADLDDLSRYQKMEEDDTGQILQQIKSWYSKRKKCLSVVDVDISSWLVNEDSRPGKLKVLVKTHKPGLPVREVFSVCGQPVENLSALLQFCYVYNGDPLQSNKLMAVPLVRSTAVTIVTFRMRPLQLFNLLLIGLTMPTFLHWKHQ